jgi:hypothetical protein
MWKTQTVLLAISVVLLLAYFVDTLMVKGVI